MNLKLRRGLVAMLCGMVVYALFATIIQAIAIPFHVGWRIIPDAKLLTQYRAYWMLMIALWFIVSIVYAHEALSKPERKRCSKRVYILSKTIAGSMSILSAWLWYSWIVQYQTKFLM